MPLVWWLKRLKFRAGGAIITSERKRKKEREERKRREKKEKRREGRDQPPFLLFVPFGHHGHYPPPSPRAVAHHSVVPQRGNDERSVIGVWTYTRRNRIGDRVLPGSHHLSAVGRRASTDSGLFPPLPAGVTDAVADAVADAVTDALFLTNMPLSIIGR